MEQPNKKKRPPNLGTIIGLGIAILCIGGILWMQLEQGRLTNTINDKELELTETNKQLVSITAVLDIIRGKDYIVITLPGNQAVAPRSYSKVYLNKKASVAYLDTKSLPKAPEGKVYQIWSLRMDPLTSTSLGLIDQSSKAAKGFYKFKGIQEAPEAFGITLEPTGGSKNPTLSQLYTLGSVPL
ncbi:MAG: hypothetical protein ACI849_000248 [Patiriisocius sp.]|jgi:hypothetical protein